MVGGSPGPETGIKDTCGSEVDSSFTPREHKAENNMMVEKTIVYRILFILT